MIDAQKKISGCITAYKLVHKEEYDMFCKGRPEMLRQRGDHGLWKDTRAGGEWRALTDIPVTLDNIIQNQTTPDEYQYYQSEKGKLWLAKTYPEFKGREKL